MNGRFMRLIQVLFTVAGMGTAGFPLHAEVKLPAVFGDHMVLQRDTAASIWGTAGANEDVTVTAGSATGKAKAGADGKWLVKLTGLKASETPIEVTVAGSSDKITFKDVLVGDVWVCGGQSNMQLPISATKDGKAAMHTAKYETIRFFNVEKQTDLKPLDDCHGKWEICTPETVGKLSAVAFFFATNILATQKSPLGLISDCWGATPAQVWTSLEALSSDPDLKKGYVNPAKLDKLSENPDAVRAEHEKWVKEYGNAYQAIMKKWHVDYDAARAKGVSTPPPPTPEKPEPLDPDALSCPTVFFNGMIHPIIPFGIKGVIWYQGEYNSQPPHSLYRKLFPLMIQDWRKHWGQGDFPFLFVQLPNFKDRKSEIEPLNHGYYGICYARETQMLGLKTIPNSAMAVTIDIGDANIHPPFKAGVGYRLALAARHIAYGEDLVYSGPLYESHKMEGNKIVIKFSHVGTGLKIAKSPFPGNNPELPTDELKGFIVCGADHKPVRAKAEIVGTDSVTVWNDSVTEPKQVYYGWEINPEVNLYNSADLPASPFRTDPTLPN